MTKLFCTCLFVVMTFMMLSTRALGDQVITIAANYRAPFLMEDRSGAGPDIIAAMNQVQNKYHFELVPMPVKRRVQTFEDNWADAVMWDNPAWGWNTSRVTASLPLVQSKDVFFTLERPEVSQDYFDDLTQFSIAVVSGYYYNFNAHAIDDLERKYYQLLPVATEEKTIQMVLKERVDVGITSTTSLNWFFTNAPHVREKLSIANRFDSEYKRYFVVNNDADITALSINAILLEVYRQGLLAPIYRKYGLTIPAEIVNAEND